MKELIAAIVCAAVLYELDQHAFDGRYFDGMMHAFFQIYVHW